MRRMKQRVTLSLDEATLAYLARKADQSTKGNVSAYVERLAQEAALAESVAQHAAWYKANPTVVENAEAERLAAWGDEQNAA
jgi:metal-dependent amidase/aminoacylase/carboxypeptidase family protein